jgi:hypothetical protein
MSTFSKPAKSLRKPHAPMGEERRYGKDHADRQRGKSKVFLQNAFEAAESDLDDLYQTALSGLYHAQRRAGRL